MLFSWYTHSFLHSYCIRLINTHKHTHALSLSLSLSLSLFFFLSLSSTLFHSSHPCTSFLFSVGLTLYPSCFYFYPSRLVFLSLRLSRPFILYVMSGSLIQFFFSAPHLRLSSLSIFSIFHLILDSNPLGYHLHPLVDIYFSNGLQQKSAVRKGTLMTIICGDLVYKLYSLHPYNLNYCWSKRKYSGEVLILCKSDLKTSHFAVKSFFISIEAAIFIFSFMDIT